jgi:Concanavalin A-like lectin/glucanases superfamily
MSVLQFNGTKSNYIEIPDDAVFSAATTGSLTVSAWMRPDTLSFPIVEGDGSGDNAYVHWMGKGEDGQQEWTFRMYNDDPAEARPSRISFYVFNPQASSGEKTNLGVGAYFQDPVTVGEWIQVVGVADGVQQATVIYKNGAEEDQQPWSKESIVPVHGTAPVRMATRDFNSFFLGAIRDVRFWNRALTADEVQMVYTHVIPHDGLVAAFLLSRDTAPDSVGRRDGQVNGGTWTP